MTEHMKRKYWKPKSLTWWVSVAQIILGVALAVSANVDALTALSGVLTDLTGGLPAFGFVSAGLAGVGIRGAL